MVRPSSDIWQLFDIEKTDKNSKAVCKFCCFKYAFPNATSMTNHILTNVQNVLWKLNKNMAMKYNRVRGLRRQKKKKVTKIS
ncbi:unnamed protein product [Acanthoscelides obtectus]|uniref:BED-type domain-containing protein n=1 Tax=Acanthoscelides obtectus TaxID=200917 RepID=A0A9P0L0C7_ACAOB|nr:unnamed protein product [Acanthoscelides obtectus]CAK1626295.1 hypothetical protein AOBTE_LOCUS3757 [Acanthoscelides obtectus]